MNDSKSKGVAVSKDTAIAETDKTKDAAQLMGAVAKEDAAGDVSGQLTLANLSQTALDDINRELGEVLHQIETGFGTLSAPRDIYALDQQFVVVDAITIPDYVDQKTGEEKIKHIFALEFDGGVVRNVMQSDARPRRVLARAFTLVRQAGGSGLRIGPYKYAKKPIPGQPEPAFIFDPQSGFSQRAIA